MIFSIMTLRINDIQNNDNQNNDIKHNDTQNNNIQNNDTQHNNNKCDIQYGNKNAILGINDTQNKQHAP